jgi:hypothetical protein
MSGLKDYNDLFNEYDAQQAAYEARLPECRICDEHIMADKYYDLGDGPICPDCCYQKYRKVTLDGYCFDLGDGLISEDDFEDEYSYSTDIYAERFL